MSGDYAAKFPEILNEAFTNHGLVLNAKQLRELAGGGSQATAQRAITAWRQDLSVKLAAKVRLGAHVPEEVLQAANGLLETLWMQARDHAAQEFAAERARFEAAQADAAARLEEIRQETLLTGEALEQAKALVTAKDAQLRDLRAEIITANAALSQAAHDFQEERQARAHQAEQARTAQEHLERDLQESEARCQQLRDDMAQAQREAAQRFDRMLVEHREAVSSVQRTCDARLADRETQLKTLQGRLEAATSEELALQMQAVRNAQQIEYLGQQADALRAELDLVRGHLQTSRDLVQATQAQLIENLRATQAQPAANG
jgi:chromosome segregation ATPase